MADNKDLAIAGLQARAEALPRIAAIILLETTALVLSLSELDQKIQQACPEAHSDERAEAVRALARAGRLRVGFMHDPDMKKVELYLMDALNGEMPGFFRLLR